MEKRKGREREEKKKKRKQQKQTSTPSNLTDDLETRLSPHEERRRRREGNAFYRAITATTVERVSASSRFLPNFLVNKKKKREKEERRWTSNESTFL